MPAGVHEPAGGHHSPPQQGPPPRSLAATDGDTAAETALRVAVLMTEAGQHRSELHGAGMAEARRAESHFFQGFPFFLTLSTLSSFFRSKCACIRMSDGSCQLPVHVYCVC